MNTGNIRGPADYGDSALISRGNLLTIDGPLSGTDDTIRYRYDSADQLIGIVGPDPGGITVTVH